MKTTSTIAIRFPVWRHAALFSIKPMLRERLVRLCALCAVFALSGLLAAPAPDVALQAVAQAALYRIEPAMGSFLAENPRQQIIGRFTDGRSEFQFREHRLSLELVRRGRVLRTYAQDNRVEFERAGLSEWYVNGPQGIEHGFTVERRQSRGRLELILALGGDLTPQLVGEDVLLRAGSETVLRYGGLKSWDAENRALPSRAVVEGSRIRLEVDTKNARYPVFVDPILGQPELTASDGAPGDLFGVSVAVDGDTAVVGAPRHNNENGAAYIFTRTGGVWSQTIELTPSTGQYFGGAVALSGDTLIVGAPIKNNYTGAAYIFKCFGGVWSFQAEIANPDGNTFSWFGNSVAIDGDRVLIGAPSDNDATGAAYVFTSSHGTWTEEAKLVPSDSVDANYFGNAVALWCGTAVVGAPFEGDSPSRGAAYIFVRSGSAWTQQAELTASDAAAGDYFGASLAVLGGTLAVGAPLNDSATGAAYIFTESGAGWSQQTKLIGSNAAIDARFGAAVALSNDRVMAGGAGTVYVFARFGDGWGQIAELTPSNATPGDAFGNAIAVNGAEVLVGAWGTNSSTGAAYLFQAQP